MIAETEPTGKLIKAYVWLQGQSLAMIDANGSVYYYHNDHLGTPQRITDKKGIVVWATDYLPFGQTNIMIKTVENNLRFPGQYYDVETGLNYNYHRYYDPQVGRYITPDPIGLAGGINPYTYCLNDPVNFFDPTGQFGIGGVVLGGMTGGAIGGIVAALTGGNIATSIAGGAVSGAIFGSGGGMVAWAFGRTGLSVGVLSGASLGAASGAAGNLTQQFFSNGPCGSINYNQVGMSASIGSFVGLLGGASTVGTLAMQIDNMAIRSVMSSNLNSVQSALPAASVATHLSVQNAITNGMGRLGNSTAIATFAINTAETFGLTAIEQGLYLR